MFVRIDQVCDVVDRSAARSAIVLDYLESIFSEHFALFGVGKKVGESYGNPQVSVLFGDALDHLE